MIIEMRTYLWKPTTLKRFLEIYSDVTQPLLSDLSFFKGLKGGNLHFVSTFEENKSL